MARMQRCLLILLIFGLRPLWHVTTTSDMLLTSLTGSFQLHDVMHSIDKPHLHPYMAGMMGQGSLDGSLLKLLKSTCWTVGLRLAGSRASLSEALSFSGSVVGALHVKIWHTNAVAGRSGFHPARPCKNNVRAPVPSHTACIRTGTRASHDASDYGRSFHDTRVAALRMPELPTDLLKLQVQPGNAFWPCGRAIPQEI